MEKTEILETLKLVRDYSKKRGFTQSVDIIINLKDLDLKKQEENINTFVSLPKSRGKENKIAALVGNELINKSKEVCDLVIKKDEFYDYGTDPKKTKKMAKGIDFFIAQANLMTDVAKAFGKVLGPVGKMPNPKAGAVVPLIIPSLKPIVDKIKNMVKLQTKNETVVKCSVGNETMKDEDLAENAITVYNHIFHLLHENKQKMENVILKLTMGRAFVVGRKYMPEELKVFEKKEIKKEMKKREYPLEKVSEKKQEEDKIQSSLNKK